MASVEIKKMDMSLMFPKWFKPEPGFKFRDEEGDPYLVIGWGGWRNTKHVTRDNLFSGLSVMFMPCDLLCVYHYKGEWHIRAIKPADMGKIMPGWTPDQMDKLSGWQ